MSSHTRVKADPPPPPPPQLIKETGETRISLRNMLGKTIEGHIDTILQMLDRDFTGFVTQELGMPDANCTQAQRLQWKKTKEGPGALREYTMTLRRQNLPSDLRPRDDGSLNVRLLVGAGALKVSHDYMATLPHDQVKHFQAQLGSALEKAVARAVNPLIATAVSQALKQRAEQSLRQQHRLKQQEKLQTRVSEQLNYQTTGFVRGSYAAAMT